MCNYCGYQGHCGYSCRGNKKFSSPICKFLKTLSAGDDVDTLIIGGQDKNVDAFVSFDEKTGIATFVQNNGTVLVVGCDQLDALLINN